MLRTTLTRLGLGTATATALVTGLLALSSAAAQAAVITLPGGPITLQPGQSVCIGGSANNDAKGAGTADNPGVIYTMSRTGAEIFRTDSRRTGPFTTSVFVGAGNYLFCAKNPAALGQPVANVNLTQLTDGDA